MQAQLAGLLAHEHAPLALAQQASGVAAPAPLFTTLLNYRHSAVAGTGPASGRAGRDRGCCRRWERTNYPLTVSVDDLGTGFSVSVLAVSPVDGDLVGRLVLAAVEGIWSPRWRTRRIPRCARVPVLDAAEREQVVAGWNDTAVRCRR